MTAVYVDTDATVETVAAALDLLGDTHEQVAATLLAGGFRGEPDCETCPIAKFLTATFPGWTAAIFLGGDGVLRAELEREVDNYTERVEVDLPDPAVAFVRHFDHGKYPGLRAHEPAGQDVTA